MWPGPLISFVICSGHMTVLHDECDLLHARNLGFPDLLRPHAHHRTTVPIIALLIVQGVFRCMCRRRLRRWPGCSPGAAVEGE